MTSTGIYQSAKLDVKKAFPFEVGRFLLLPGRKLCGFLIQTREERGSFKRVLNIAAKYNAILKIAHFYVAEGTKVIKVFFDLTDCTISPEKLQNEIGNVESVLAVTKISSKIEGFIADTLSNPLLISGARTILLRTPGYEGLIKRVRERFGSAADAFLYYQGIEVGMEYAKNHREIANKLGVTDPQIIFEDISLSMLECMGMGKTEIVGHKANPTHIQIRIYNSFECEAARQAKQPYSQLLRGVIAGMITELYKTKVTAKELKCIAKGDKYCEFEVKQEE
ncbi:MAG: V4R domain-containing protein [Candidatus Bathyarchaeia archaeon]